MGYRSNVRIICSYRLWKKRYCQSIKRIIYKHQQPLVLFFWMKGGLKWDTEAM